jgi:hypothetical protein
VLQYGALDVVKATPTARTLDDQAISNDFAERIMPRWTRHKQLLTPVRRCVFFGIVL